MELLNDVSLMKRKLLNERLNKQISDKKFLELYKYLQNEEKFIYENFQNILDKKVEEKKQRLMNILAYKTLFKTNYYDDEINYLENYLNQKKKVNYA
jgi:hypothetical protein